MPTKRRPWIAIDVGFTTHPKLAELPNDSARWGWLHILAMAKKEVRMGEFRSVAHLREVAGRFARFIPVYRRMGLLDPPSEEGRIRVHDWVRYQRDTPEDAPPSDDGSSVDRPPDRPSIVGSSSVDRGSDHQSSGLAGARSRPRARVVTRDSRQEPLGERTREEVPSAHDERPDVALLLDRFGFKRVTKKQLAILDEVASNERVREYDVASGWRWNAEVMAGTPEGTDPIEHLTATENGLKAARLARAEVAEREWQRTKEQRPTNGVAHDDEPDPWAVLDESTTTQAAAS